jgi:DNA-binding NtrC family response regulator
MSLRDFFSQHREELLRACESELNRETNVEQLARELCDLLEQPAPQIERQTDAHALLGEDCAITKIRVTIGHLARRSRIPVLFLGEVGTGKRRSARLLHASTYPDGEFFELRDTQQLALLEQKLAALRVPSSALAVGGMSVHIPELAETSKAVQAVLAQILRDHSLRLRLSASARQPLTQACRAGLLRSDLVFGFSTTVELPNLRDRTSDLPLLLAHFASQSSSASSMPLAFSDAALVALAAHQWPGNLTELSQLVERLLGLDKPGTIEPQHLSDLAPRRSGMVVNLPPSGIDLADLERDLLIQALALSDNNRSRAARLLGLTRDQIRYRLNKLELDSTGDGE